MILIKKAPALEALLQLKQEAEDKKLSDKDGYRLLSGSLKRDVKKALLKEQGHLCAYCMRRISDKELSEGFLEICEAATIEHWQPLSQSNESGKNKGLDYTNLLAVCSGNEPKDGEVRQGNKRGYLICDKKKENTLILVNPLDETTLKTIRYGSDGKISSTDGSINRDITETLNLNCEKGGLLLPQNRKAALEEVQQAVFNSGNSDGEIKQECINLLAYFKGETDPKTPYVGIIIWWLQEQIESMS